MPDSASDQKLQLEVCDVFLTRGTSFVSRAIRFFTQSFGEERSQVNHVGIVVEPGSVHSAVVVEALVKVKRHPLRRYGSKKSTGVAVFRPTTLSDDEKVKIVEKANAYVDRTYGWVKIFTHLADWGLQGAYVFRRFTSDDDYPICSWLVAHAYLAAGKTFGVDAGAANPDDIWDFVDTNPDKYVQLRDLGPIPEELETFLPA